MTYTSAHTVSFLHTGGTIASGLQDGVQAVGAEGAGRLRGLLDSYEDKNQFRFAHDEICRQDSAELTHAILHRLLCGIQRGIDQGISRFVVTHGTDSLPYTAALLDYYFGDRPVTIALLAATRDLSRPDTDGLDHAEAAMQLVVREAPRHGVFIPYTRERGAKGKHVLHIHDARTLLPMQHDSAIFLSRHDRPAGALLPGENIQWRHAHVPAHDVARKIPAVRMFDRAAEKIIGPMDVATNMSLRWVDKDAAREGVVLILRPFHSGTAPATFNTAITDFARAYPHSRVVVTPLPEALLRGPYEPTHKLIRAGIPFFTRLEPHYARSHIMAALAGGMECAGAVESLKAWRITPAPV